MPDLRLRPRGFRVFVWIGLLIGAAATLGGIFDPPLYVRHESDAWGWAILGVLGLLLWRSCRVGLDVGEDMLFVRTWLRTRRLSVDEVAGVLARPYDGLLTRGSQYNQLACVTLGLADGPAVTAWGLVGGRRSIHRMARTLAIRLNVPVSAVDKWDDPIPLDNR